jgi:bifunctional UDP-N-acetylglucosamine pyrophosphorylase/glucosamine-1-phosphate N-acetyltransferase
MTVKLFMNRNGKFTAADIPSSTGLWQTVYTTDVNGDGYTDIVWSKTGADAHNWTYLNNAASGGTGWTRSALWDIQQDGYSDFADGATLADPERIDVRGSLVCGRDASIDVNCVFEGVVVLGEGVSVGANCVLRNVKVAAGSRIEPFCHLDDADIGARCRIGPYARLRPGTTLAEEVHIGNFVEVKASRIAARSKANHLSYVGDSTVGRDVNIGAGTITCNYDGANKHRTIIEDGVHIGSDTQLVAPVTVGAGSTSAAGTTIYRDVPPGGLVLTKAEQIFKPGWKRPVKKK